MFELENLDARTRRIERARMFGRTGHLALQATGALAWIDKQRFLQFRLPVR
jgi:hypothetical protein